MLPPWVRSVNRYHSRDLRDWTLGQSKRGAGGGTCIPEEAKHEIQELQEALDLFLGNKEDQSMIEVRLITRLGQLHLHGHIPYLITPMDAARLLGQCDTSSLPSAVLMSPAMGETASDGRGYPVVKHKPGI